MVNQLLPEANILELEVEKLSLEELEELLFFLVVQVAHQFLLIINH